VRLILPVASEVREYGIHRNLRRRFRSRVSCVVHGAKFSVENTGPVWIFFPQIIPRAPKTKIDTKAHGLCFGLH
jgi:hypothetical protein